MRARFLVLALLAAPAAADTASVEGCGIAAGGNVRESIVNCGVAEDKVDEILALLSALEAQGNAARAREENITQKAIVFLAQRIAEDTETFDQALNELENAVRIAIDVQRRGDAPSNAGPFVDAVLARVAALSREGEHDAASETVDEALAKLEAAEEAIAAAKIRIYDAGIDEDLLRRDPASAATRIVARAKLVQPDPAEQFAALRAEQDLWYVRGRDKGLNLELAVSVEIARLALREADGPDERGAARNDLGGALQTLGEREGDAAKLGRAVDAYRAALLERTRERVPLGWAATQNDLGIALQTLGARENGAEKLDQAVDAYRAALLERTRERVPLEWAITQNNLGNALSILGLRENDAEKLDRAVDAYRAALLERTRARVPLDWAMTQNNLGAALKTLGAREGDAAKLDRAVDAYRAALLERTRERVPLDWAKTSENISLAEADIYLITGDPAVLARASERLSEALAVYRRLMATYYVEKAERNLAWLDSLSPGPKVEATR